jgi:hypothetical protein
VSGAFASLLPPRAVIPALEGPACPSAILPEILNGDAECFSEYKRAGNTQSLPSSLSVG